jgi:hypothetical protein
LCACSLDYPQAKGMRRLVLSTATCPYYPTLSYKRQDFRDKKIVEHRIVVSFSLQRFDISIFKVPVILERFSRIFSFLD